MNKKVIIISVLGLVGVGAFFYFKPKSEAKDKDSSKGGALGSTSDNPSLPSNTTQTSTTPTSTLSVPPTQTSVTINDVVLTTPAQVVETAFKISEAKNIATQISDLKNKKNLYPTLNLRDWARETNARWKFESQLPRLREQSLIGIDAQIKELDKTLALLGYMEVNGSIVKI